MVALVWMASGLAVEAVEFASPESGSISEDGVVSLRWESEGDASAFELQQATQADFSNAQTRYEGPDRGSVITGLGEGSYFFRVRSADSQDWSEPVELTVQYMNMALVWTLMGVGLFVFVATVVAILRGHAQQGDPS